MTEHEMLKEIIQLIWYKLFRIELDEWLLYTSDWPYRVVDVREIIFNPEFKSKVIEHIIKQQKWDSWNSELKWTKIFNDICNHLQNPTQYLYDTLLWKTK